MVLLCCGGSIWGHHFKRCSILVVAYKTVTSKRCKCALSLSEGSALLSSGQTWHMFLSVHLTSMKLAVSCAFLRSLQPLSELVIMQGPVSKKGQGEHSENWGTSVGRNLLATPEVHTSVRHWHRQENIVGRILWDGYMRKKGLPCLFFSFPNAMPMIQSHWGLNPSSTLATLLGSTKMWSSCLRV